MTWATPASIALAAGALLVPACGGGDGGDGLSREELVNQADAICQEYDQRAEDIEDPQGLDDVERYVGETKALITDGLDELKELEPPEELAADYDAWIAQSEENLALFDDLEAAAADEDPARLQQVLAEAQEAGARTDRRARELGFQECGAND